MTALSVATLESLMQEITPPSEEWRRRAFLRLDMLTKPPGSLGRLEDLVAQMLAIRQREFALPVGKAVYIFAADHGITAEGVSAYPREVTHQMVLNFLAEGAAINVLARLHGVRLHVVDVGVDADLQWVEGLLHHKVSRGSRNMLHEAAMTREELLQAISVGVKLADEAATAGHTLIAVGEMGIGNTTSASAIACALTGSPATHTTGRGTGVQQVAYANKTRIVQAVVDKHFNGTAPSAFDILQCVGGLEIAAMTGMMLACARQKMVVVVDGFISTAAAALAVALAPHVRGYLGSRSPLGRAWSPDSS